VKLFHVELKEANKFVVEFHRHHKPAHGHRFSIGVKHQGKLVGVAIIGRPVARAVDHKTVVEALRLCTDGTKNACSFLYGAAARAAKSLGYKKIQTYILEEERGTSLVASNYSFDGLTTGGSWNCPSRKGRREDQPQGKKKRLVRIL